MPVRDLCLIQLNLLLLDIVVEAVPHAMLLGIIIIFVRNAT